MEENKNNQIIYIITRKVDFLYNLDYDNQDMDFNLQLKQMQRLTLHFTLKEYVLKNMYARNWFWRLWNKKVIENCTNEYCEKAREINISLDKLISLAKGTNKQPPK